MNKKTIIWGMAVVVALVLSVVAVTRPATVREIVNTFGAQPGADSDFSRRCDNGVCRDYYRATFAVGTTTACVFKSPQATSSVTYFYAQPKTATGTAFTAVLATSTSVSSGGAILTTTGISTTSMLTWAVYAANSAAAFVFEPGGYQTSIGFGGVSIPAGQSVSASTTPWILPPNTYLIYEGEGGGIVPAGTSAAQTGACTASLIEL